MSASLIAPARRYATLTPSDTVDFANGICRAIYVGGGGDVAAVREDGTVVVFSNVQSGAMLPIMARRVNATATTATLMDVLY